MASCVRYILFTFMLITVLKGGESQFVLDQTFLQKLLVDYFFPKDMGIVKVKSMDQARGLEGVVVLDFIGMVEQYKLGYTAEEHIVTTEDGYILQIHRISGSPLSDNKKKKDIVFLQHSLLCTSDVWVVLGPGKALAFLLADQGYDVWVGNVRGNAYGRSHINMTVYDRKFWDISIHDIGMMDLPATLNYILNHTGQKDLHYVSHSMGSALLSVLLSMKPEYNAKIKLFTLLAPAVYPGKHRYLLKQIIYGIPVLAEYLARHNVYEFGAQCSSFITIVRGFCHDRAITQPICIAIYFLILGADPLQMNTTALPYILSHFPAGAAMRTIYHYYQIVLADNFQSFDYGPNGNYARYKQKTPIIYDMSKVVVPAALYYSSNDIIVTNSSVLKLIQRLSNLILAEEVPYQLFSHADFVFGIDAKTLLYDRVIEIIQNFDVKQNHLSRD